MTINSRQFFSLGLIGALLSILLQPVSALTPTEVAKLLASDAAAFDHFGISVSVSGDTALIGAFVDDDAGSGSGSAYVLIRDAGVWTEQAKLTASDAAAGDLFGSAVSVDGDTALIGARADDDAGGNSGSAYVFFRSGTTWTQQAKLTASDAAISDTFGVSVSVDGDTALVSAPENDDGGSASGSAYVFTRSGATWTQQAKLTASDGVAFAFFGTSVSMDGDTALIGAQTDTIAGFRRGSAYVFTRSGTTWTQQSKLTASDAAASDIFGRAVSVDGDTALIGATWDDDAGSNSGSAYVFTRSGTTWTQQAKLIASDAAAADQFASAVALDGGTALIGTPENDDAGSNSGSAYVFSLISDDEGPLSSNVTATPNPLAVNTPTTLTANVDDTTTGGSDIASANYTIDGGTPVGMTAQDGGFDEVMEGVTAMVPAFTEAGVHQLCVSGTDAAGNTGEEDCTFLAVYDPAAGFVTGGGWIESPADACYLTTACEGLTGKANFGFVSKYKKGAQTPSGNTEFQFKAGDLNFHSDSYEWLVIASHRAQYKGVGRNGPRKLDSAVSEILHGIQAAKLRLA